MSFLFLSEEKTRPRTGNRENKREEIKRMKISAEGKE